MNFEWSAEQLAFRERLQKFLVAELPENWEKIAHHGPGSDATTEFSKHFCGRLAEEGLLMPHWPVEIGGQGLDAWYSAIVSEEM